MGRTLFVGIDIGADTNVVRIIDDTGDDVCGFSVSNDIPGTEPANLFKYSDLSQFYNVRVGYPWQAMYQRKQHYAIKFVGRFSYYEKGTQRAVLNIKKSILFVVPRLYTHCIFHDTPSQPILSRKWISLSENSFWLSETGFWLSGNSGLRNIQKSVAF